MQIKTFKYEQQLVLHERNGMLGAFPVILVEIVRVKNSRIYSSQLIFCFFDV